jgi:hypothetical protein
VRHDFSLDLLAVVHAACWIYFGLATFRRRHYWMFWIGFILPILWIIGALIAATERAAGISKPSRQRRHPGPCGPRRGDQRSGRLWRCRICQCPSRIARDKAARAEVLVRVTRCLSPSRLVPIRSSRSMHRVVAAIRLATTTNNMSPGPRRAISDTAGPPY